MREGFDPDAPEPHNPERAHNIASPFEEEEDNEVRQPPISEEATEWQTRDYSQQNDGDERTSPQYGSFHEERNAWSKD